MPYRHKGVHTTYRVPSPFTPQPCIIPLIIDWTATAHFDFQRIGYMAQDTLRILSMASGVILLAGLAAWMGLAHGCDAPTHRGTITGRVTISPTLVDRVQPTDVLYVIVRPARGSRRPLAVKRIERPHFPVDFEITKNNTMVQGEELQGMVHILARLDKDGAAGPAQAGDLEGAFAKNPTLVGRDQIDIQINTVHSGKSSEQHPPSD